MNVRRWAWPLCISLAILLLAAPAFAKVLKLRVDPSATEIVASVDEPFARIRGTASGTFQVITGEIDGDPADPVKTGHVDIVINATTYQSDSPHRDNSVLHDTLETRFYPVIKFVSTRIEDLKWDAPNVIGTATIVGNLTLHGVTREMRVPISATLSTDGRFSADGDVQFDCTDFNITPPHALFGALKAGKIVDLNFRVIAVPSDTASSTTPSQQ
jgi:polyisoprenoid-binding protein YceI